ncbi:MAG: thioredoxin TrxC [Magnetococcales bacterium]|nr:thioredoxin TrxC [Magnetococcales bacterium]
MIQISCPACGVGNRIPTAKTGRAAKCGKCHEKLPRVWWQEPVVADDVSFQDEVLDSHLPVLVDFWAPWCAPCRTLSPGLVLLAEELAGRLKVVKVNTDENPGLAKSYQIHSIPTLMLFSEGDIQNKRMGAMPVGQLRNWINRSLGWL